MARLHHFRPGTRIGEEVSGSGGGLGVSLIGDGGDRPGVIGGGGEAGDGEGVGVMLLDVGGHGFADVAAEVEVLAGVGELT